jgi:hypothetical protein
MNLITDFMISELCNGRPDPIAFHRLDPTASIACYPIASGVIEGACRHVVKDLMERSGMRWVLEGAHTMLA